MICYSFICKTCQSGSQVKLVSSMIVHRAWTKCFRHCVSKKRPTFDLLYNVHVHNPITIIFGRKRK